MKVKGMEGVERGVLRKLRALAGDDRGRLRIVRGTVS